MVTYLNMYPENTYNGAFSPFGLRFCSFCGCSVELLVMPETLWLARSKRFTMQHFTVKKNPTSVLRQDFSTSELFPFGK